jgi:hypothetical protein
MPTIAPIRFVKSWSHSRVAMFEQCKHRVALKHLHKIPEPDRPLPPGKLEHANDRGTRIHDNSELFAKDKGKLLPELAKYYRPEMEKLRELFKKGNVLIEDEWGMNQDWEPCDWKDAWLRLKIDALVFMSEYEAVVIDLKTGRREGNEIKHAEQVQLYQLVTFLRFPKLETIHVELWYIDIDEMASQTYRRDQGLRFQRRFHERGMKLTTYEFKGEKEDANPSDYTCRWCFYGPKGSGICKRGK